MDSYAPLSTESLEITELRATMAVIANELRRIRDLLARVEARELRQIGGTFWSPVVEGD